MFKKNVLLFLIITVHAYAYGIQNPYRAFCKITVADVVSRPLGTEHTTKETLKAHYSNLPASWDLTVIDKLGCPRIHQLLLHEIVTVLQENDYEAYIEIPSLIVARNAYMLEPVRGWVLKDSLCLLEDECLSFLPHPIEWQQGIITDDDCTVALISPYVDDDNKFYSVGTRFVLTRAIGNDFNAIAFDDQKNSFKEITIPQALCAYQPTLQSEDKRILFCTLIKLWSEIPDLKIPLVWGGASIGNVYATDDFYLETKSLELEQTARVWQRPHLFDSLMGVDASNLVARATQLVGIPYFFKNSLTASLLLEEVGKHEYPRDGDLIWLPGSLIILNDIENNLIVTTMSYASGYGYLAQLSLGQIFQNITTINDLIHTRNVGLPLTLLNHDGSIARTVEEFKILKLIS